MRFSVIILLTFLACQLTVASAQPSLYSTANAHSHNDYAQQKPFRLAYGRQFGSIETDIHLVRGLLLVGHDSDNLIKKNTLASMYLAPLASAIKKNNGHVYQDSSISLQLLIDLKTGATTTMAALVKELDQFPGIIHNPGVRIIITGNRPPDSLYTSYPGYIWFDGVLDRKYDSLALTRIALLSDDFRKYSQWLGKDSIRPYDKTLLSGLVNRAHRLQKPIRFWACPDSIEAWKLMIDLGVDFINTDHIDALSSYLKAHHDSSWLPPIHSQTLSMTFPSRTEPRASTVHNFFSRRRNADN